MTLQLKIVSEHRDLVGDDAEREFHEEGGTIGRSLQNDWILPDPDRYISGRHATIDHKGGIYYLLDTSSNGVYFNDEVEPVGKGNPRRLFDGDRIRMGDFQFTVSLDSGESLAMPLDPEPSVVPDKSEQFVDEISPHSGAKLIDEDELTGDDEFQSVLFGDANAAAKPSKSPPAAKKKPSPVTAANDSRPARKQPAAGGRATDDLFDAFLDGLGVSQTELHPAVNRKQMMLTAGHVLREFVEGTVKLLSARSSLKNAFRLDQTTVMPRHNNPLKLSDNPGDLVKQLLVGDEGDYLNARDAVHEACQDLLNHQNAFLDAMNSAFIEFAERFEPEELQEGFDRALNGSKLLSFMNKSKYWDLYCDLYPIITAKGGGRFPQMFGEEFVRAYERQVAEYQRHDREGSQEDRTLSIKRDPGLMATQKLEREEILAATKVPDATPSDTTAATDDAAVDQLDQSFVDELDNSMAEEISPKTA